MDSVNPFEKTGMAESLDEFKNPSRQAGSLDSQGHFTIQVDVAREKSARFNLENEGDWALRVLQALLTADLKLDIEIQCLRKATVFRFELKRRWQAEELRDSVFGLGGSENPVFRYLEQGLLAPAVAQKRSVEVQGLFGDRCLRWDEGQLSESSGTGTSSISVSHLSNSEQKLPRAKKRKLVAKRIASVTKSVGTEFVFAKFLEAKCNVFLDGRKLDTAEQIVSYFLSRSLVPLYCWGSAFEGRFWFRLLQKICMAEVKFSPTEPELAEQLPYLACISLDERVLRRIVVAKPSEQEIDRYHSSNIHWVRDGVVLARDPLPIEVQGLGIQVFCSANDHETDLTRSCLIQGPERQRRVLAVQDHLCERLADMKLEFWGLRPIGDEEVQGKWAALCGLSAYFFSLMLVMKFGGLLHLTGKALETAAVVGGGVSGNLAYFGGGKYGERFPKTEKVKLPILDQEFRKLQRSLKQDKPSGI